MQMTEGEILRSYREAKNPKEQIKVLAELNAVPEYRIVDILKKQGVDGRVLPHPRRPKKQEAPIVSAAEHVEVIMTALQYYKQSVMDEIEAEVNKAEAKFTRIEAALAFIREACAR